jgi:hypothetical protein
MYKVEDNYEDDEVQQQRTVNKQLYLNSLTIVPILMYNTSAIIA